MLSILIVDHDGIQTDTKRLSGFINIYSIIATFSRRGFRIVMSYYTVPLSLKIDKITIKRY